MNITSIFEWSYWFYQPFIARGVAMYLWVGIFLFAILAGLVLKFLSQKNIEKYLKNILNSLSNFGLGAGLIGLVWLFMRQEMVPFLGWRFWLLIILFWGIYLAVKHIRFMVKRLPAIRAEHAEKEIKEKYLPKK